MIQELGRDDGEDEVVLRGHDRLVQRFVPDQDRVQTIAPRTEAPAFRLTKGRSSSLDDLVHQAAADLVPGPREVVIKVAGAGLNFSDVMKVLDLYPGLPPGPVPLGAECSGEVMQTGTRVTEFAVGDKVIAIAPGGFASHVCVEACLVAPAPKAIDLVDAAAIPVAYLTADHAIHTCGKMRSGESILVHAASGGVGLAAIDIAHHAGVEVFATAGTKQKRAAVAKKGVQHLFDSRSLDFADEILSTTASRDVPGVDAVLNSLPGEAIRAGLSVLKTGGRFLEIGKRDIYADASLGLYPMRNNLALFAIDLDQLFKQQAIAMGERLRALVAMIDSGDYSPEPPKRFASSDAAEAFRFMRAAKHVGKVVVDYTQQPTSIRSRGDDSLALSDEGTYWVVGGLGGFGLPMARYLAERGVKRLVLSGRRVEPSEHATEIIDSIRGMGTEVELVACDITDADAVEQTIAAIQSSGSPLRGVMHTAMVLEDRLMVDLDLATLHRVLWPKLIGGWNLHHSTKHLPLDHFILFSSLTSVFGHAGQANYSAANAMLDGIAHHRRTHGLPATVINWGHVGEVGYLAERQDLSDRLRRQGVLDFSFDEATRCLATAINRGSTQCSVLRMDWSRWRGLGLTGDVSPRFAHLIRGGSGAAGTSVSAASLRAASPTQRVEMLRESIADKLASLLGCVASEIDADRPMLELGLDSLMAVELRNWIENQLQLKLQIGSLMRGSSLAGLVENLAGMIDQIQVETDSDQTADSSLTASALPTIAGTEPDTRMSDRGRFPMSDQQTGLWYAFRRNPEGTSFNVFLPTRIRSAVNVEALRKSIRSVVARHACLRTTFTDQDGELQQVVHDDLPVEFDVINLADETTRSDEDLVAIAREHVVEETRRPFDLQDGPLLRLKLFQIADDDFIAIAVTHHIVVDFWSLILILNELRSYYPSYAADQTPTIEPPQRDYFDFVAGQRQLLQSARGHQLKRYWTSTLRDIPAVLEVPTDYPRPAAFTGKAKVAAITCPRRVGRRVNELASQCQTTTSSVVLAALQVMLQRLTRQERFIIGSPFAGRTDAELEDTVGFFVNMLPLVADLTGQPSFEQLVRRAGNRLVDSIQHEEYPFAQIVRDLDPPRDTGRSPLIQVSCTFEKAHVREEEGRAGYLFPAADTSIEVGGLNQESFYIPHQTCHYDLEFIFEQSGDDLHGMIVYCEDLYAAETVSRWSTMFVGLLEELLDASRSDQPEQHVSEIGWGDAAWQRHQPRVDQKSQTPHRTNDSKPQHSSIVAWLDESARRFADEDVWYPSDPSTENADPLASPSHVSPDQYRRRSFFNSRKPKPSSPSLSGSDASASSAKPQRLAATLGELRRRVNSIATSLSNAGISKGQLIPVAATASQPAMTMALSVMRAGGVPVPIDVTKPSIDAVTLIQQTSSDLALIEDDSAWSQQLPHHVDCLRWDDARVTRENTRSLPPIESITADDLAHVIFTSGTTGTPKGVMVPHRGIVNTLSWRNRITPIGPGDRVMVPLSHQFDAGFGLSLLTILSGATLVHPGVTDLADIDSVLARMIEAKVSVMVAVPSLMDLIASHPRFGQTSSLRHVWIGGESMPESLPKLIRMGTDAQIWNCYGPTEASVEATAYRIDDLHDRRHIPVGKPADGTDVVVLKSKRLAAPEFVPDTVVGEIALVGDGLANGYLGDPELTDTVFVTLPDGRRAYRTGDQGRRRVDGLIEVIGRIDRQIQVGGYRIEPVEVETVLRDHVSVAQAAVVPRTISDVELLVAYVELETSLSDMAIPKANSDAELSTRDIVIAIRHHLAEHLPPYKRPKRIEVVSKLPISASGKVDLASLPKSDASWMDDETVTPPSTSLEKFLAKAWGETLGVDQIGVSQNFFEYGGTSLQAAMLTNRLSEHLAVHVPSSLLFDLADISSMAQRLTQLYPKELRSQFDDESVRFYDGKVFAHQRVTKRDHLIAPLKPTGDQTPIFMVHPPGGIVVCYRELANAMPDDQPLFAIRSQGLHGRENLPESMTDMAAEYVDAIRSRQASGPYIIGGWSIGGIIASEVVRQLLDSQNDVKRLILLDTSIPSGASDLVPKEDQANVGLEYGIDLTLDELVELKPEEQLPFLWQHAERMGMLDDSTPPDVAAKAIDDLKHLFHHHLELARVHRIKPIKVDALLVRPSEIPFDVGGSADRGWSHLLRRVDVETIPGHHHSMVQMPAAEKLADVIVASIGGLNVA
ncbi:MAG: SDR family NAD(P)-dependent oxidoreductase [Planctomycetota bacterium]